MLDIFAGSWGRWKVLTRLIWSVNTTQKSTLFHYEDNTEFIFFKRISKKGIVTS